MSFSEVDYKILNFFYTALEAQTSDTYYTYR